MKPLLLVFMLLTLQSNGQKVKKPNFTITDCYTLLIVDTRVKKDYTDFPEMFIKCNSDTLVINHTGLMRFIKIGERVYKIESPTLTEVKPVSVGTGINRLFSNQPNTYLPYYFRDDIGTWSSIDTTLIIHK